MFIRLNNSTALMVGAVFVYSVFFSALGFAQAPIIDASADAANESRGARLPAVNEPPPSAVAQSGGNQGELYNQLLILQQEVMQLRGIVEQQSHQLRQLKEQNMERYIDIDRRLAEAVANPSAVADSAAGDKVSLAIQSAPVQEGEKAAYDTAYSLVISKRFDDALESFKQFLVDFPEGKYAPNSYYWMGELYQVITPQDLEASRQAFSQLLAQYPDHAKAADAMYKLGKVYFLKGRKDKSREWLNRVLATYGQGPYSSTADKARRFINTNF